MSDKPSAKEFYEKHATNVVNVPRPNHPEDPSGWAGVRRASEAQFIAKDVPCMPLWDVFDFAEKYAAAATPQVTPHITRLRPDEEFPKEFAEYDPEGALASAPQVTPELELEKEADGRWLAAYTRFPGVAAYGPSKEEAIRNAAKVLIESGQASPTLKETLKQYGAHHIRDCDALNKWKELPCDCGFAALIEGTSEQAPPTPDKSRDTGVSLDGGKTIHSKFKND